TVMFRLCDSNMYTSMSKLIEDPVIDRGIALHKMIRLVTLALGGEGYLNFMGNEFGHPEWIDFPREGNGWSYFYCRRQWHLADDPLLKYGYLREFDRAMISLATNGKLFSKAPQCIFIDAQKQVLVFERNKQIFAFNFSPNNSYEGYYITVPSAGDYEVALSTDDEDFGGWNRISKDCLYKATKQPDKQNRLQIYLPARTAVCLSKVKRSCKK
ncbi:MAG: alpha amylase C-terminal domain-containing protein, partial [Clostridia bacterium]|nr:alpha amylase C-terminal domain-containing protein [Clostridia bacterium]